MRLAPTAEKPPPLAVNCTWPGPLPKLPVKSPAASSTTPPSSVRLLAVGKAAELLSRRMPPETVVGPEYVLLAVSSSVAVAGQGQAAAAAQHAAELGIDGCILVPAVTWTVCCPSRQIDRVLKIDRRIGRPRTEHQRRLLGRKLPLPQVNVAELPPRFTTRFAPTAAESAAVGRELHLARTAARDCG